MPDDSTQASARIHFRTHDDDDAADRREESAVKNKVNLVIKQNRRLLYAPVILAMLGITTLAMAQHIPQSANQGEVTDEDSSGNKLSRINHIVVIYQENHSFDNLYGVGRV